MATVADAVVRLLEVLNRLEIPYLLAGSAASSIHGLSRPTMDADFVADLHPEKVKEFAAQLQTDFYRLLTEDEIT